ncbi:MAG: hypothetical protein C4331_01915 [Meiothermus sp.]
MQCIARFEWDEEKRLANLEKHGLDFEDAWKVFESDYLEIKDAPEDYGEDRFKVYGIADFEVVIVIHTPRPEVIRIISMRKADRDETNFYYEQISYQNQIADRLEPHFSDAGRGY